jgi:2-polyprenyl-3-methyl-5-hydroxy-6-metoxy-1,4-benzoquinol methylase
MKVERPWQLDMFRKGLKKNLRLKALKQYLGEIAENEVCLLVTCGDNNGAMNYFLREIGGKWTWADMEPQSISEMSQLLGDPVHYAQDEKLPFEDESFDRIISIDVHEHVDEPQEITAEIARVAKPDSQIIITVPNGDETKLAVRIKHALKMTKEAYGHQRVGLTATEVSDVMTDSGIEPDSTSTFSRFFTEMLELTINFLYVKVLNKDEHDKEQEDHDAHDHADIAPATKDQLESVSTSYRIYSIIFPIYWLLSKLDVLLVGQEGYCVMVSGRKLSGQ